MIRFCDKEVYTVQQGTISRSELLTFFLNKHQKDVVQIVDESGQYVGIVTYRGLLNDSNDINIYKNYVVVDEKDFWLNAKNIFKGSDVGQELIAVFNEAKELLGFCYEDKGSPAIRYITMEDSLKTMEEREQLSVFIKDVWREVEQVFITDCNEYAYRFYIICKREKFPVCVQGEKWNWFHIKQLEDYEKYPEYAKLYIYAEGTSFVREEQIFADSLYTPVEENFQCISTLGAELTRSAKKARIKALMRSGVNICEVTIPNNNEVSFFTEEEKRGLRLKNPLYVYWNMPESFTEEMKENLYAIYGKEECERLREQKGRKFQEQMTLYPPKWEKNKIYLIGPCIVDGQGLQENSLASKLQNLVGEQYRIVKMIYNIQQTNLLEKIINELAIRENDILIFIDYLQVRENLVNVKQIDLKEIYNKKRVESWFGEGIPIHTNAAGNEAIANKIYEDYLKDKLIEMKRYETQESKRIQKGELIPEETREQIKEYLSTIHIYEDKEQKEIGAIVMNCNPFTKGHQHLIEYAAKQVDALYVFVVEEDRSFFKFEHRLQMVKEGTKHLANVSVYPSGQFILSYTTVPIYFEKEEKREETIDAKLDLHLFGRYIAPELGINCRFVGEEPMDMVTKQYNEQMKEVLGEYEIEVCEIPRKEQDGQIISASLVRKLITSNQWDEARKYMPEEIQEICKTSIM